MCLANRKKWLRNVSVLLAATLFVVMCIQDAGAFDGHRRGFTIGFGLGWGAVTHFSVVGKDFGETSNSLTAVLPIGYGLSDVDIIAFLPAPSFFKSEKLYGARSMQGLWSIRWYHFLKPTGRSPFLSVGAGRVLFSSRYRDLSAYGPGVGASVGYELFRHVTLDLEYFHGWTSEGDDKFSHDNLSFVLTAWAY